MNRETWLQNAIAELDKAFFAENGYELPEKLGVSCGFPKGHARAIGQCWDPSVSADETTHMFICPTQDDRITVLGILLHEMIHAAVGCKAGHKGPFRKLAKEFGLEGKMTATVVTEGSDLWFALTSMSDRLGDYPHSAMRKTSKKSGPKSYVRFISINDEAFKCVTSRKIFNEFGAPRDPWGDEMSVNE